MISVSGSGLVELNTREFLWSHSQRHSPPWWSTLRVVLSCVPLAEHSEGKYNSLSVICITLRPHSFHFIQTEPTHGLAGVYIYVKVSLLFSVYSIVTYSEIFVKRKYAVKSNLSKRLFSSLTSNSLLGHTMYF
mgnify:CR=1 FL=1